MQQIPPAPDQDAPQQQRTRIPTRSTSQEQAERRRSLIFTLCVTCASIEVLASYTPIVIAAWSKDPWIMKIFEDHFAAVIGLPLIALLAFILVVLLEARFDKIEMEFFGVVRFKGASGPIILWGFCFLLMATAVKLLW
ncbi:hypothetical protein ACFV3E_24685 [Streptomyces sp. NPDC059718]